MSSPAPSSGLFSLNFTKLSRAIVVLLSVGYGVQLVVPSARQYLALVPGRFIPCVWSIFTAGLLEVSVVKLALSSVGILLLARLVEPVWGSKEFLKFICVVNGGAGLATLIVLYLMYAVNQYKERSADVLYYEVTGFHGVFAGCLVALKQIMPDNEVTVMKVIKFRAKHLPGLFVLISTAASALMGSTLTVVPFVVAGTYTAWFYLRYFQSKPGLALLGDPSDEFRFATFFPDRAHPAVDYVAGLCARILPFARAPGAEAQPYMLQGEPLPGSDSAEAARRRERGARVLEARLGAKDVVGGAAPAVQLDPDIEAPKQINEESSV